MRWGVGVPMANPPDQRPASHSIDMNKLVASMQDQLGRCRENRATNEHSIFRVPSCMRRANPGAFDPQIISIGPYHYRNRRLSSMQEQKWKCLNELINRNPKKGLTGYIDAIKSSIDRARRCYSEEIHVNDEKFVQMLLLDASFIIEFLLMEGWKVTVNSTSDHLTGASSANPDVNKKKPFDPLSATSWAWPFIIGDLLKLENQVPFFVVQKLCELVEEGDQSKKLSITDRVYDFVKHNRPTYVDLKTIKMPDDIEKISHLLHFYHSCFFAGRGPLSKNTGHANFIPTAHELREAGVKFRRKENGGFMEVTFSFSDGVMQMTPLMIGDDFDKIIPNLIAFEECYPQAGVYVIGYSLFLDCLIDTAADASLLCQEAKHRVIESRVGSHEVLAQMVNRLCYNVADYLPDSFVKMFADVNKYHSSRRCRWRAKLMREYFGNPWSIVSLIAAIVLLLLAGLQTVFTMISYLHPAS